MRLGFITDRSAYFGNQCFVDPSLGRLIHELQRRVDDITVAISASPKSRPAYSLPLQIAANRIIALPPNPSIARGFFNVTGCAKAIRTVERQSDVVVVQLPFSACMALLQPKRPRVYQVCANVRTIVQNTSYYRGIRGVMARSTGRFIDHVQRALVNRENSRFVAHGQELWRHLGPDKGRAVISSALYSQEIMSIARVRPFDAPFRVLYVGYLRHEKGVDLLLTAFRQFLEHGRNAELVIVGAENPSPHGVEELIYAEVSKLNQQCKIHFAGHAQFGHELFQHYANADVLVVPSRSEGTPRVLVEARAFGCPVIGTNVGGIPTSITHGVNGLLVPPNDANAIAEALIQLHSDAELRRRLIQGGYEMAKACTVERLAESILSEAEQVLDASRNEFTSTNIT